MCGFENDSIEVSGDSVDVSAFYTYLPAEVISEILV